VLFPVSPVYLPTPPTHCAVHRYGDHYGTGGSSARPELRSTMNFPTNRNAITGPINVGIELQGYRLSLTHLADSDRGRALGAGRGL
jgi:hypothetical protein